MRILIVTTKRISSTQLSELNKHYSVLCIGKAHLKKRIEQLGSAELMILNLNFGMLHPPSKNEELQWVNQQNLSGFKVVYAYSKPKYMKSFVKANLVLKSLPVVVGHTLEAVLAMSERLSDGNSSVSLSQDDLGSILEEVKTEITPDDIIRVMGDYKQLQHDFCALETECKNLRASALKILKEPEIEPERPILERRPDNLHAVIAKLGKPPPKQPEKEPEQNKVKKPAVKSLKHVKNGIQLISAGIIIDTLQFHNRNDQRNVRRQAMKWLRE
jgi:hypothetical protein